MITCDEVYVGCREWFKLSACADEGGEPSEDMLCVFFFKKKIYKICNKTEFFKE